MLKRYLVTGNWYDKKTNKPLSGIAEIVSGVGKESGKPYEMAQTDARETAEGTYPVGTVLTANVNFSVQDTPSAGFNPAPAPKTAK